MANEWYLSEYQNKTYLHNKALSFRQFSSPDNTHRHCELCWARISNQETDHQRAYFEQMSRTVPEGTQIMAEAGFVLIVSTT